MNEGARPFLELLHGGLHGWTALWAMRPGRGQRLTTWTPAARWPNLPRWVEQEAETVALSVCTFAEKQRPEAWALEVPALWTDLDPPDPIKAALEAGAAGALEQLAAWRAAALRELRDHRPAPSLIVDSGRGWHGYWLLVPIVLLEGSARARLVELVKSCNRALAARLGGDTGTDLARVLRVPGTVNRKPGGGPCLLLSADGPRYRLEDLAGELAADRLRLEAERPATRARTRARVEVPPAPATGPRRRGRRSLGATVKHLLALEPWARPLVVRGWFPYRKRYRSRSEADMAAVGAMVRGGWPDARIFAAFARPDWLIGDRYRQLRDAGGQKREDEYLARTIGTARARQAAPAEQPEAGPGGAGAVQAGDAAITTNRPRLEGRVATGGEDGPPAVATVDELAALVEAGELDPDRLAAYLATVGEC